MLSVEAAVAGEEEGDGEDGDPDGDVDGDGDRDGDGDLDGDGDFDGDGDPDDDLSGDTVLVGATDSDGDGSAATADEGTKADADGLWITEGPADRDLPPVTVGCGAEPDVVAGPTAWGWACGAAGDVVAVLACGWASVAGEEANPPLMR